MWEYCTRCLRWVPVAHFGQPPLARCPDCGLCFHQPNPRPVPRRKPERV